MADRMALIGNSIKTIREAQGKTRAELARLSRVAGSTIHRIEAGEYAIQTDTLFAIADALGVSIHDVLAGSPTNGARTGADLSRAWSQLRDEFDLWMRVRPVAGSVVTALSSMTLRKQEEAVRLMSAVLDQVAKS